MRGTTGRRRVPKEAILKLKIPVPPSWEQEEIANILLTVDKMLELEYQRKHYLEELKRGFMDLLLTGKIRIENTSE